MQILKDVPYGIKDFRVQGSPKSTQKTHQKLSQNNSDPNTRKSLSNKRPGHPLGTLRETKNGTAAFHRGMSELMCVKDLHPCVKDLWRRGPK